MWWVDAIGLSVILPSLALLVLLLVGSIDENREHERIMRKYDRRK